MKSSMIAKPSRRVCFFSESGKKRITVHQISRSFGNRSVGGDDRAEVFHVRRHIFVFKISSRRSLKRSRIRAESQSISHFSNADLTI